MENPTERKHSPWLWVAIGCSGILIAAFACVVVAAVAFFALPGVRAEIARVPNPNVPPPALLTPRAGATAAPNAGSGGGPSVGSLPFTFSPVQGQAVQSNQSLMDQMVSSLNLNNDSDFMAPKTYKGTATLDPSAGFTLGNGWCAKDAATLKQNLADMQFQFSINGTNIDLSKYPTLFFTDNQGQSCAMTGISITPNGNLSQNFHMVLTQKFQKSLSDGITSSPYPAGDVTFDFNILFSTNPNGGSSG